jgi:hypothetical protein
MVFLGLQHRVVNRDPVHALPTFAGGHSSYHPCPIGLHQPDPQDGLPTCCSLYDDTGPFIDENCHGSPRINHWLNQDVQILTESIERQVDRDRVEAI